MYSHESSVCVPNLEYVELILGLHILLHSDVVTRHSHNTGKILESCLVLHLDLAKSAMCVPNLEDARELARRLLRWWKVRSCTDSPYSPCPYGLGSNSALSEETPPVQDFSEYPSGVRTPRACPVLYIIYAIYYIIYINTWKLYMDCKELMEGVAPY